MFERFSQQAREVIVAAQNEASDFKHDYVGTGHMLIGLSQDGGVAGRALANSGVDAEAVRRELAAISGYGDEDTSSKPFTPPAKKVLEAACDNAGSSGRYRIDPGDLLLALIEQPEGVATEILTKLEIDMEALQDQVRTVQEDHGNQS